MSRFFSIFENYITRTVPYILAGGAVIGWVFTMLAAYAAIPFRYAYNYAEPAVAATILAIPQSPLLYHNFQHEPFLINPYNPLYYYLSYAVMLLTGPPLPAGRYISFAAGVVSCFLIYRILRSLDVRRILALLFAALFVQLPLIREQWAVVRPDFLGLALSLGGILFLLAHERDRQADDRKLRSNVSYGIGVTMCCLAILTKQNFVAAPASYFLYLATERRFRDAAALACVVTLGAGTPVFLWNHWTDGQLLLHQAINVEKSFYLELFFRFWGKFLPTHAPFLLTSVAAVLWSPKRAVRKILFFYLLLSGFSTITLGKIGADMNYFLEFIAAICLTSGLFAADTMGRAKTPLGRAAANAFLLIWTVYFLAISGFANTALTFFEKRGPGANHAASQTHSFDPLVDVIRKTNGPVLAENMGLLIAAGKPVVYAPYEFAQMTYAGLWDEKKILDKLDRKEFPLILLETNLWRFRQTSRFTPGFVEHLRRNYRPVKEIAGQIVCVPATT